MFELLGKKIKKKKKTVLPLPASLSLNACCPRQTGSLNMQHGNIRKIKNKKKITSVPSYNLGYFTLWWGRMEREGSKEAEDPDRG